MPTTDEIRDMSMAAECEHQPCGCAACLTAQYARLLCDEVDAAKGEYPESPEERDENIRRFEAARRAREEAP